MIKEWIISTISEEEKESGPLNFIFCSEAYLLKINQEYLNHDSHTDIITFNYNEGNTVSGDIFIDPNRVTENASQLEASFEDELHRVIIHGVLHLIGYNDNNDESRATMRAKEDFYLTLRPF